MRNLSEIAQEIRSTWKNPFYGAIPYLDAMAQINSPSPSASYYLDDARSIVIYFLCNATNWRGEDARRIKKELKQQYHIN